MFLPYLISGTVMELSAMLVARIIFLCPGGALWNTRTCSSAVMVEWRGRTHHLYEAHWASTTVSLKIIFFVKTTKLNLRKQVLVIFIICNTARNKRLLHLLLSMMEEQYDHAKRLLVVDFFPCSLYNCR